MPYAVTTITVRPGTAAKALPGIEAWLKGAAGTLLGCWTSDIGALNRILILRDGAGPAFLVEHDAMLRGGDPCGGGETMTDVQLDLYEPFPFLPPVKPGSFGPVYEMRHYVLKPGGVSQTIAGWEKALPKRLEMSPVITGMYSITGLSPRFMHIWPYASLNDRARVRGEAVAKGIWPPPGGGERLVEMRSDIYLPTAFSPLK